MLFSQTRLHRPCHVHKTRVRQQLHLQYLQQPPPIAKALKVTVGNRDDACCILQLAANTANGKF